MAALAAPLIFMKDNPVAMVACVVAYIVIGMLWYGPIFRKSWAKMTGVDKVPKAKMKKQMFPAITISVISSIIQASVLGTVLSVVALTSIVDLLTLIIFIWFPFTATVFATNYAYSMKSVKLLLIDAFYPLLTWIAMAFIFLTIHY